MSYSFQLGTGMGDEGNSLMIFVFLIFKFFSSSNTVGTAIFSPKKNNNYIFNLFEKKTKQSLHSIFP